MSTEPRFGLLRRVLRAVGLSQPAVNDIVDTIVDMLAGDGAEKADPTRPAPTPEFPYHMRDHFLSPAELNFFEVLRTAVGGRAALCTKVGLGDVFWVKKDDPSRYRIYTNKIDRKHVDFLLCEPTTMRPLIGIELDDKSHERQDRQERDAFVDNVFKAAGLPLLHIPVRRGYDMASLNAQISPYIAAPVTPIAVSAKTAPLPQAKAASVPAPSAPAASAPRCPKCGGEMVLRTAKSGSNAGGHFWGCSNYPGCRSMLPYQG